MRKNSHHPPTDQRYDLPAIVYICSFLLGILLFLLFGESLVGVKPNPFWIALVAGLSVSVIVFWVWGERHKDKDDNDD